MSIFQLNKPQEWCNLSIELYQESMDSSTPGSSSMESESFLNNFRSVASQASSKIVDGTHSFRNLPLLMDLSMQIKDYKLGIQLAGEIISTDTYSRNSIVITAVVAHIREILASEMTHLNPSSSVQFGNRGSIPLLSINLLKLLVVPNLSALAIL